jgi:RsiW-degrading membrane proteinase PrsW (M82 family)
MAIDIFMQVLNILISLLPVTVFLVTLIFLDSYKLVRFRILLLAIGAGAGAAVLSYFLNSEMMHLLRLPFKTYSRYVSPVLEEVLKASIIFYFFRSNRIGFLVDGAILGFATGTGFALVENVYYLSTTEGATLIIWLIRGFGTAIMQGGATALLALITKSLSDRKGKTVGWVWLPGLVAAFGLHSVFNHFFLQPAIQVAAIVVLLPAVTIPIFVTSEKATRAWLDVGFDSDVELLGLINSGVISTTKIGTYLVSLTSKFPGEIVADMLCLLRLHLELSISAKGILLMKESGFPPKVAPGVSEKFRELDYLKDSIGPIGMLAIRPVLHMSSRDLWELHMLGMK